MKFNKQKTACFSGYRPHKFDFPLNGEIYDEFAYKLFNIISEAIKKGYDTFIIGGAPGFDIIAAELMPLAKHGYPEIKVVFALPYANFKDSIYFDDEWRNRYDAMAQNADFIINVSESENEFSGCYMERNKFMADNSSLLICYHTGKSGGTKNTMEYAKSKGLEIINIADKT